MSAVDSSLKQKESKPDPLTSNPSSPQPPAPAWHTPWSLPRSPSSPAFPVALPSLSSPGSSNPPTPGVMATMHGEFDRSWTPPPSETSPCLNSDSTYNLGSGVSASSGRPSEDSSSSSRRENIGGQSGYGQSSLPAGAAAPAVGGQAGAGSAFGHSSNPSPHGSSSTVSRPAGPAPLLAPTPQSAANAHNPYPNGSNAQPGPPPPLPHMNTQPAPSFARVRSSSYGNLVLQRKACSESRVLSASHGQPRPLSTASTGGTMILYRFEQPHPSSPLTGSMRNSRAQGSSSVRQSSYSTSHTPSPSSTPTPGFEDDSFLPPPTYPFSSHGASHGSSGTGVGPRGTLVSTASRDSMFSMNLDSKYPMGERETGCLVPYAYDPDMDVDDDDDEDYKDDPHPRGGQGNDIEFGGRRKGDKVHTNPTTSTKSTSTSHSPLNARILTKSPSGLSTSSQYRRKGEEVPLVWSWRGLCNVTTLIVLVAALMCLFILYPILELEAAQKHPLKLGENVFINKTGQAVEGGTEVPVARRWSPPVQ